MKDPKVVFWSIHTSLSTSPFQITKMRGSLHCDIDKWEQPLLGRVRAVSPDPRLTQEPTFSVELLGDQQNTLILYSPTSFTHYLWKSLCVVCFCGWNAETLQRPVPKRRERLCRWDWIVYFRVGERGAKITHHRKYTLIMYNVLYMNHI